MHYASLEVPTIEESEVDGCVPSLTEYRTKVNNYYITFVQNRSWGDDMSFGS